MKSLLSIRMVLPAIFTLAAALLVTSCASPDNRSASSGGGAPAAPRNFSADDGRIIDIGKSAQADGGTCYDNPHLEKGKCWVATGFNFKGYDTIYIAPTRSTARFPDKPEDTMVHNLAKERLVSELASKLNERKIFPKVVTSESEIQPGAKVLKLENTITDFTKGGGAARYFVGLYGGGQPVLRVQGNASAGGRQLFTFAARRIGTSAGARVGGVFMKDEDIQIEDIRSLVLDLTDFMAAVAGNYPPKG